MRNQIVILAAGKGTRMGGDVPKVLVMLKNKPLILHLLDEVEKVHQLAKPIIVVGYMYNQVRQVLGDGYTYAIQDKQLGTAHALLAAKHKAVGENILALYGDAPFIKASSLKALISLHFKSGSKISMLTARVPNFAGVYKSLEHAGRIIRDTKHGIISIVEFKDASTHQKKIKEINPGIYIFNSKWLWKNLEKIQNKNSQKEYYLTDIISLGISQGEAVKSILIDPKEVLGVNSREDLALAERILS